MRACGLLLIQSHCARDCARDGIGGVDLRSGLAQELAREALRQQVIAHLEPLVEAQIALAMGLKFLVTRDKALKKFIRVGRAMASHDHEETIEVWEKDPSIQAFADLMNRALDKPVEQPQDITLHHDVNEALLGRLDRGRARLAEGRAPLALPPGNMAQASNTPKSTA